MTHCWKYMSFNTHPFIPPVNMIKKEWFKVLDLWSRQVSRYGPVMYTLELWLWYYHYLMRYPPLKLLQEHPTPHSHPHTPHHPPLSLLMYLCALDINELDIIFTELFANGDYLSQHWIYKMDK